MAHTHDFTPDWVSSPGNTIADLLARRQLSHGDAARALEISPHAMEDLVRGRVAITCAMAARLAVVLGGSESFWMHRESQYRDDLARLLREAAHSNDAWLSELPVKDMISFGWLAPTSAPADTVYECLRFFDVPHVRAWRKTFASVLESATFRTSPSFDSLPGAVAAWLRRGEIEADSIDCAEWDPEQFKTALTDIRHLTRQREPQVFIPRLRSICAKSGVAIVVLRSPSGCRASGATRFVNPSKAILLLSMRYRSDDQFWFSFFHEAAHLLLHGRDLLFLEDVEAVSPEQEREANEFAANTLIPPGFQSRMHGLGVDGYEVIRFAKDVGVSPGIVVGQLQHYRRFQRNQLNNLKRWFTWGEGSEPTLGTR